MNTHITAPGTSTIGERIAMARARAGLTATELSNRINITARTVTQYEKGKSEPPVSNLVKIADALGTSASWIAFGSDISAAKKAAKSAADLSRVVMALSKKYPEGLDPDRVALVVELAHKNAHAKGTHIEAELDQLEALI